MCECVCVTGRWCFLVRGLCDVKPRSRVKIDILTEVIAHECTVAHTHSRSPFVIGQMATHTKQINTHSTWYHLGRAGLFAIRLEREVTFIPVDQAKQKQHTHTHRGEMEMLTDSDMPQEMLRFSSLRPFEFSAHVSHQTTRWVPFPFLPFSLSPFLPFSLSPFLPLLTFYIFCPFFHVSLLHSLLCASYQCFVVLNRSWTKLRRLEAPFKFNKTSEAHQYSMYRLGH